jgi:hypothetical protein
VSTVTITQVYSVRAIQQLLEGRNSGVVKDLIRRGTLVESAAKKNLRRSPTRVNTGRLSSSITWRLVEYRGHPAVWVGTTVKYAIFVHEGTGLYGPRHKMIRPVNKKVLRWKVRGGGRKSRKGYTYAKWSRGMRPNPFMKDALPAARG